MKIDTMRTWPHFAVPPAELTTLLEVIGSALYAANAVIQFKMRSLMLTGRIV